eukprot:CAMPEP_0179429320 /NCGR_PEP_ID=MMETSP0799-20121207/14727_1 /TAXON_ID=46947 /ORGANISM="Geminigera cryophila, Strain CCMP2564" /LENGTH=68 /DNA_ID=CAMNT_0021205167 /DNA_START=204 /DNA_END=410 /DNA_ORIENTATION=-
MNEPPSRVCLQLLSVADAMTTAQGGATFPTYSDAITNSSCADFSYTCGGAAVKKANGDFFSYSMSVPK